MPNVLVRLIDGGTVGEWGKSQVVNAWSLARSSWLPRDTKSALASAMLSTPKASGLAQGSVSKYPILRSSEGPRINNFCVPDSGRTWTGWHAHKLK